MDAPRVIRVAAPQWNDHHEKLEDTGPFSRAVNEVIGRYWVLSGRAADLTAAMLEVLARDYDERHAAIAIFACGICGEGFVGSNAREARDRHAEQHGTTETG